MKKILFTVCLIYLFSGCSPEIKDSAVLEAVTETTIETVQETFTESNSEFTEELTLPENALNINDAKELLLEKLRNYGYNSESNQYLEYEETKEYNNCPSYIFRNYDDFDDHRATTGWYAVNPVTGECFDTLTSTPMFYSFEITENGVEIYKKYSDEPLQILEIDPEYTPDPEWLYKSYQDEYFDHDPYRFITMNDFDFDGYDDIQVWVYLGATNGTLQYYRFNPDAGLFEKWHELNEFYHGVNVSIKDKTLSVSSKGSAVDHYYDVYKWTGDKLTHVSGKRQYDDYGDIYIDYLEYDEYGNEILIKKEKVILDENHEYQVVEEVDFTELSP